MPGLNRLQWWTDLMAQVSQAVSHPFPFLTHLFFTTPLNFTVQNPAVILGWKAMTGVADLFLGLFIVIGAMQMMYGEQTGMLFLPARQLVMKAILTTLLIHLSATMGQGLLQLNNLLCTLVAANTNDFIRQFNGGHLFTAGQGLLLDIALLLILGLSLFRLLFQAVKRIVRFNLLFVLSGPAFLFSFHPSTASICSTWMRIYAVTIFEQFLQVLTFTLGWQFLIATK